MPDRDFQVIFNNANNLSRDRYVNTIFYDIGGALDSGESVADGIAAAYRTHLIDFMGGQIASMTIKVYTPGRNPGGPELSKNYAFDPASLPGPAEVALCLSYFSDFNQPRRRGRIYLGPFANAQLSERPEGIMGAAGRFAEALAAIGAGTIQNWRQHSVVGATYNDVTNWFVDNAWDTQRRRGATPTARQVGTV